jgi:hypothetical protein
VGGLEAEALIEETRKIVFYSDPALYIKQVVLKKDRELGSKFGLQYAEAYHYIWPPTASAELEELIRMNAVGK